jgi:hypothetical protein
MDSSLEKPLKPPSDLIRLGAGGTLVEDADEEVGRAGHKSYEIAPSKRRSLTLYITLDVRDLLKSREYRFGRSKQR